jgi:uncharacterized protein YegL
MTQVVELDINKQYILAGDVSGSMQTPDPLCSNATRYDYMLEKFKAFIKEAESFDPDGPTVILFGQDVKTYRNVTLEQVQDKLSNPAFEGFTMTHLAVNEAYNLHKAEKSQLASQGKVHPGTVVMIFTDGAPTSRPELEKSIVNISNQIDTNEEFSILFLTVGTIPADLQEFLAHLDNDLKGKAKFDIVEIKKLEEVSFLKAASSALTH